MNPRIYLQDRIAAEVIVEKCGLEGTHLNGAERPGSGCSTVRIRFGKDAHIVDPREGEPDVEPTDPGAVVGPRLKR